MTLLYRSPNVLIDKHEWHVTVMQRGSRPTVIYRFRPIGQRVKWRHITEWVGPVPKGMSNFFQPYRKSVRVAMGTVQHARQAKHLVSLRIAA